MKLPIPDSALANHIAVLGKTGAGKTSTSKAIIEHVVEEGDRVCILDPIKSDWWGITSSGDGTKPGLPFTILGGPHGSLPLHPSSGKALGQLVGSGKLPLSILDMADFDKAGDLQGFFSDFAAALVRHMRGVLYLVAEEAHEFAPKERAGFGNENQAIHWAKKLATAGRSKGIRLIVATQRVQALHNAVLGSCETLIAHRLTTPADQDPVLKWVKANADKEVHGQVAASLSSLPTGTAWVVSGEAQLFDRIAFPKFATFDNTATPDRGDGEQNVVTAKVDENALRDILGEAVEEARANDPKALKAEVARLTRELAAKTPADSDRVEQLQAELTEQRGIVTRLAAAIERHNDKMGEVWDRWCAPIGGIMDAQNELFGEISLSGLRPIGRPYSTGDSTIFDLMEGPPAKAAPIAVREPAPAREAPVAPKPVPRATPSPVDTALPKSQQRVLDAIAWWGALGFSHIERRRACVIAGLSPKASTFGVYISKLAQAGLVDVSHPGAVGLTDEGKALATVPENISKAQVVAEARGMLSTAAQNVFDRIVLAYPNWISRDALADECGLSRTASTLGVYISKAGSLGFVETKPGHVRASDWLFP